MKKIITILALILITKAYGQNFMPLYYCSNELFYVSLEGGYKKLYLPKYRYGFIGELFAPPSSDAFTADDDPDSGYIAPAVGFRIPLNCQNCLVPDDLCVDISGNFFNTTEKSDGALVLPDDLFIQFPFGPTAVLPSSTFSGVTVFSQFKRKYRYNGGRVDFSGRYLICLNNFPVVVEPIFFSYSNNYLREIYNIDTQLTEITATISVNQKLTTTYNDFGAGLTVLFPVWRNISLFATNILYGSHASSKLRSLFESNQFDPMEFSDKHNNVSLTYRASLGLVYNLRCVYFGLKGNYEYRDYVPAILNPQVNLIAGEPLNFPLIEKRSFSNFSLGGYAGVLF